MYQYKLIIDPELNSVLVAQASLNGVTPEVFINDIVKRFLSAAHNMDRDSMAEGYEAMGAVNLGIADIKLRDGQVNAKADEHKKGGDLLRRPEPRSGE